jgi:Predicted methyltransferase
MYVPWPFRALAESASRGVVLRRKLPKKMGGATLFVSPDARLRYWYPSLASIDPWLLDMAVELVSPGDVVWDIGANVGLFSFAAAGLAGPSGRVIAIECDPWLVSLLRLSARANHGGLAPVDILPVAASAAIDIRHFCIAQRGRSSNHLDGCTPPPHHHDGRGRKASDHLDGGTPPSDAGGIREIQYVPTVTLDWLTERFPPPRVLKIDVEGAEEHVLRGGERLLREARPIVLCEVSGQCCATVGQFLSECGYILFDAELPKEQRQPLTNATWNTLGFPQECIVGSDRSRKRPARHSHVAQ